MYFILQGANFPDSIGQLQGIKPGEVGSGGTGGGTVDPNATLTINPSPSDATVVLTATGYTQSGKSITVAKGTQVAYTVSKTGYITKTGTIKVSYTQSMGVSLVSEGGSGSGGDSGSGSGSSNYTLIHGNKYASGHETNTARASISPLTIIVPNGVTITNKSTIKWAYYTGVNTNNMPSGTGSGTWGDYKYTGTGAAIGIAFKKADDSAFDWSVDSTNPADYFDVSDEGLWNGTAQGTTPEPEEPEGAEGTLDINAFNAMILAYGNPFGTTEQQSDPARVHSEVNLYAPAGTVISLKDNTNYKWALKKVTGATGKVADSTFNNGGYVPDAAWSTKESYTTTVNGYWKFVLLKASNAAFDWSADSQKVSDYFTVS